MISVYICSEKFLEAKSKFKLMKKTKYALIGILICLFIVCDVMTAISQNVLPPLKSKAEAISIAQSEVIKAKNDVDQTSTSDPNYKVLRSKYLLWDFFLNEAKQAYNTTDGALSMAFLFTYGDDYTGPDGAEVYNVFQSKKWNQEFNQVINILKI